MERERRLSDLVDYIVERGSVRLEEVLERFDVSPATARRDLDALADQQLVTRTRGGAIANGSSGDVPLRYRTVRQGRQKGAISLAVADSIEPGSVIAFNGGTTTTMAAYEVGVRSSADEALSHAPLTVVTNAINIANDLIVRPQLRVVVLGGAARMRSYELIGPLASLILPAISIDTLYLGVSAIDLDRGLFTHDEGEAAVNAALVEAARRVVVVADSTKLATTAFARICGFDAVDALITDDGLSDADAARLAERGLDVTRAGTTAS
ncbi:DeoR/GlpR family DNA-binding transcription regulator [Microbacterium sp. RURRCA19A]|uniref:DeoR/GlpR family DNA-binding transcription regulator n=1 Tax=Microbacterium sp. RURRCA19A TaxID=1907391 RepID=UPI000955D0D9|nr:DeoR/GlpR family DNA-binding transcription regulator [Microbacterium sp. RURRCA19A]SIR96807.1 transcriptional regulator, DeoR family [Microbacterium sp. RURRCA19A]